MSLASVCFLMATFHGALCCWYGERKHRPFYILAGSGLMIGAALLYLLWVFTG
jgi:hypothetical protein